MKRRFKLVPAVASLACSLLLAACAQQLPKTLEVKNAFGTVQEKSVRENVPVLMYEEGIDPKSRNWGRSAVYEIKVDGESYKIHWEEATKLQALKIGDKVNLHPSSYIVCEGENERVPECTKLMRIYKSDTKINPIVIQ